MPVFFTRRIGEKNLSRMSSAAFMAEIRVTLAEVAHMVRDMMETTVASWESQPSFSISYSGFDALINTDDKIWNFLDNGTSVRYAIMSNPYYPKTHPHFIGSDMGDGYAVRRGRSVNPPRPGIEARAWSKDITKIVYPYYRAEMRKAIARGVTRMMRGT